MCKEVFTSLSSGTNEAGLFTHQEYHPIPVLTQVTSSTAWRRKMKRRETLCRWSRSATLPTDCRSGPRGPAPRPVQTRKTTTTATQETEPKMKSRHTMLEPGALNGWKVTDVSLWTFIQVNKQLECWESQTCCRSCRCYLFFCLLATVALVCWLNGLFWLHFAASELESHCFQPYWWLTMRSITLVFVFFNPYPGVHSSSEGLP